MGIYSSKSILSVSGKEFMKKKALIFAILIFGTLFLGTGETVEEIIAIVNNDIITLSDYENQHQALYQMLRSQLQGDEFYNQYNLLKSKLLENMISELLLFQEAKEKGIDVTEQVNINIENIKKENNIQSDEQLRRELARQNMSFETFKKKLEEDLLKRAVIFTEVDRGIVIDDSEIVSYYKLHPAEFIEPSEFKVRAIYLSTEGKSEEELEARKEEISLRLQNGEDMSDLATQYSEGPEKESHGDLGSFKKGELEENLQKAIENLKLKEISPWLKIKNGWYLLRLEERKESRIKPFEDVREIIQNNLFMEKKQKKLEEFFKKLREKSYVKIINPNPLGR